MRYFYYNKHNKNWIEINKITYDLEIAVNHKETDNELFAAIGEYPVETKVAPKLKPFLLLLVVATALPLFAAMTSSLPVRSLFSPFSKVS